ncbi:hypothetical protein BDZ85DRAFT_216344, partial [Elsinoe ampelina]
MVVAGRNCLLSCSFTDRLSVSFSFGVFRSFLFARAWVRAMDPLSVTASIIAILTLTHNVGQHLNGVRDAPRDCEQCAIEIANLVGPLTQLKVLAQQAQAAGGSPWLEQLSGLNVKGGVIDQYAQALHLLQEKVKVGDSVDRVKARLVWPFQKKEVENILQRMERLKSLITLALTMDHRQRSEDIKEDTAVIRAGLTPLQAQTSAIGVGVQSLQTDTTSIVATASAIQNALPPLQASSAAYMDAHSRQQHEAILKWLHPVDASAVLYGHLSQRQEGTCQWFFDSMLYKDWQSGAQKTLFCPGIPGAGKTTLAAAIIDHLKRHVLSNVSECAYIFCNYKSEAEQTLPNLLAGLLQQVVRNRPDAMGPVAELHNKGGEPTSTEYGQALLRVCSATTTTYLIIDALDECSDTVRDPLLDIVSRLQANHDVRLLCTSRLIPDVEERFQDCPQISILADSADVRKYLESQSLPKCVRRDPGLQDQVYADIVASADGIFLLARLHVDSLRAQRTPNMVRDTLEQLSKGSNALEMAYEKALDRIEGQLKEDSMLAKRVICWISYAQRPLTVEELITALAVKAGDTTLDKGNCVPAEDVVSVCAGLVAVDDQTGIVRLVHLTAQEFFARIRNQWYPRAELEVATTCWTYLTFDGLLDQCLQEFGYTPPSDDFFKYVREHCVDHILPVEAELVCLTLKSLQNQALLRRMWQVGVGQDYRMFGMFGMREDMALSRKALHFAARHGLVHTMEEIIRRDPGLGSAYIDSVDSEGSTPLVLALQAGHEASARILLREGASIHLPIRLPGEVRASNALEAASQSCSEEMVRFLIDAGAVVNMPGRSYRGNCLQRASRRGHVGIVRLLLEGGSHVNADLCPSTRYGGTALALASEAGHEAIVDLLLKSGAHVDGRVSVDPPGPMLVSSVAFDPQDDSVQNPRDPETPFHNEDSSISGRPTIDRVPLVAALFKRHEGVARQLLDAGADIELIDEVFGTALQCAASSGNFAIVELLIEKGADINRANSYGTALQQAARDGHLEVVKLLIEKGADMD